MRKRRSHALIVPLGPARRDSFTGGPPQALRRPGRRERRPYVVAVLPLEALDEAGVVVVPGWRLPGGRPAAPEVLAAGRRAHGEGATVAGLCLGAFVLGGAGLLGGRRAITHWARLRELTESFPAVEVQRDALFVDEGRIVTSAGSAAGIDACLHLLRREHGPAVANATARSLVVAPQRRAARPSSSSSRCRRSTRATR
ncbi:hypothetical protein Aab01nite_42010 [Paractinoplanes abujensis]|uniref:Transcriptional regulator GlxA family with amidase domain n=1 Tax=Paractinoplanes abujensis TaxID=882441 RepID=A0A7W7CTN0_9ACTN|nr:DJ-1/PfpI family protein [Actinoplanes abujensis]MBB4694174.1 transcriptional regulator GlxA family with amidase domain [Actinoplanes abujensis]GID20611.1 hypothetical protein Aab01nite_42010 [Actinoplanes abujensis]